ncbi:hypothetical protein E1B28_005332 [Marasmius oreades]|uniref:Uncharacterized protein n=1 Tax=Marasmius oreades TaxID=181124 RepID=A0A9P7UUG4_9AGAR|nr:uncharacterized protein E1B28_005332 [Marasmius oreades]KAG7094503.1 hypothetical protein E1B28_005332 [Marasmius oreades]
MSHVGYINPTIRFDHPLSSSNHALHDPYPSFLPTMILSRAFFNLFILSFHLVLSQENLAQASPQDQCAQADEKCGGMDGVGNTISCCDGFSCTDDSNGEGLCTPIMAPQSQGQCVQADERCGGEDANGVDCCDGLRCDTSGNGDGLCKPADVSECLELNVKCRGVGGKNCCEGTKCGNEGVCVECAAKGEPCNVNNDGSRTCCNGVCGSNELGGYCY